MTVSVLLFASARERMGLSRLELSLPEGSRVSEVLAAPELAGLAAHISGLRFAVNEEFAALDAPVKEGDVVAVLPPVSGG